MTLSLSEIRHKLVIAAQEEYDRRIDLGIHPYSMASYHFANVIDKELAKHVDTSEWKAGNWRSLQKANDFYEYEIIFDEYKQNKGPLSSGLWAVSAYLNSAQAWATPGFAEAYQYHSVYGG